MQSWIKYATPERQEEVLQSLIKAWDEIVAPNVVDACCVLAGRVATEALRYMDIRHLVVPIDALAFNSAAFDLIGEVPADEWGDSEAWSVGAMTTDLEANWSGHVVVVTDDWFLDLSANQFNRFNRSIVLPNRMLVKREHFTAWQKFNNRLLYTFIDGTYYCWQPTHDERFRNSYDWRDGYRRFSGRVIRSMKESLRHPR